MGLTWARVLAILSVRYNNVAAFDFNNLLTSNGGDPGTDDLGSETGNQTRPTRGRKG